jgi:hypothetical protein
VTGAGELPLNVRAHMRSKERFFADNALNLEPITVLHWCSRTTAQSVGLSGRRLLDV